MGEITLSIPDELLVALKVTPEQCGLELRLAAAVKLYEMGRLSSGAAAKLAGIPRVVFLSKLADYGVDTFRLSSHDLAQETPLVWGILPNLLPLELSADYGYTTQMIDLNLLFYCCDG